MKVERPFPIGPSTVGLRIGEKRNAVLIGISYTLRHLNTYPYATNHSYSGALLKLGYEF
jgi:hypothetical protein